MAEKIDLKQRADKIMEIAEAYGAEKNFVFITTFKSMQDTMFVLNMLMKEIRDGEAIVTKEYVKGRENRYVNPAVAEYNKTMKTFNDTVSTLMRIIDGFKNNDEDNSDDPLLKILRGDDAN